MGVKPLIALIAIIIPNYNGEKTIGLCLKSIYKNPPDFPFEVIVVDDCSDDGSTEIIKKFPCRLIRLARRSGASRARNEGARNASGEALFFIDADCLLTENTLPAVLKAYRKHPDAITGGTYTPLPYDTDFFSTFQSIFINYSEGVRPPAKGAVPHQDKPDYIATHAMLIGKEVFKKSSGFKEDFLPIIEDVEFSHRLRRQGVRLVMDTDILVRHIFGFSLFKSLKNAFRKSLYWTVYSIGNKDLLRDSGTASIGLKADVVSLFSCILLSTLFALTGKSLYLSVLPIVSGVNLFINRRFLKALLRNGGASFFIKALLYYMSLYPLTVGFGSLFGALKYFTSKALGLYAQPHKGVRSP
ncbi:MAG: glycosyltransferase family 2 protein [Thermodesulfovibrionales bacterium]|nr:glycosyltransferase family 2 protein [Thermodesulfovibrionales bacterium]